MTESQNLAADYAAGVAKGIRERAALGFPFGWRRELDDETTMDRPELDDDNRDENGDEWVEGSAGDWIADALDLEYVIGSNMAFKHARVFVTVGGPTAWVDTESKTLECRWGDKASEPLPYAFCEAIEDYLEDIFNMSRGE
jgi:hypothetical protein